MPLAGMIEKGPLTDADVALLVALLERVRPRQLYAAGDLSDPHGTHRTCLQVPQAPAWGWQVIDKQAYWGATLTRLCVLKTPSCCRCCCCYCRHAWACSHVGPIKADVPGWQAILRALDIVRTQSWFGACRVWLYRGAWQVGALHTLSPRGVAGGRPAHPITAGRGRWALCTPYHRGAWQVGALHTLSPRGVAGGRPAHPITAGRGRRAPCTPSPLHAWG